MDRTPEVVLSTLKVMRTSFDSPQRILVVKVPPTVVIIACLTDVRDERRVQIQLSSYKASEMCAEV